MRAAFEGTVVRSVWIQKTAAPILKRSDRNVGSCMEMLQHSTLETSGKAEDLLDDDSVLSGASVAV